MIRLHASTRLSAAFVSLVCFPACFVLVRYWSPKSGSAIRWIWLGALSLLVTGIAGPALSATRHMLYHDEPTMIAIAAAELHGQPLYHAAEAGARYSLLYGPVAYWVYQAPMLAGITDLRIY